MDNPSTVATIFGEVQNNLYEAQLRWFTSADILNSLQDQYNKVVALMAPIESSTFIPQISEPYYNLSAQISDYMYLVGIYNPFTNLWLEGLTYKQLKATYQTYLAIGHHKWVNIVDFQRVLLWPYNPGATGVLYVMYKAAAPLISMTHIPQLPHSVGGRLLEYLTMADLFEQAREFNKAKKWLERAIKPGKGQTISIFQQCLNEIKDLARIDRERVLEPYRWIFHGGQFLNNNWISGETPSGTIDGVNATFTLAQVPNPTSSVLLQLNGQNLYGDSGYSLNGQTITINTPFVPQKGDELKVWYQIS